MAADMDTSIRRIVIQEEEDLETCTLARKTIERRAIKLAGRGTPN